MFDQQPFIALRAAPQFDQNKAALESLALETKLQLAAFQLFTSTEIPFYLKCTLVSNDDFTRAIVSLGDDSLEIPIFEGMILDLNSKSLVSRIQ